MNIKYIKNREKKKAEAMVKLMSVVRRKGVTLHHAESVKRGT